MTETTQQTRPVEAENRPRWCLVCQVLLCAVVCMISTMAVGCSHDGESNEKPHEDNFIEHAQADEFSGKQVVNNGMVQTKRPNANSANIRLTPAEAPASKPIGYLSHDATCVTAECHAGLSRQRHVHGPVGSEHCETCHGEDTGSHQYPLLRKGDALCTYCHQVAGVREHQHQAIEEVGCMSCHEPHGSPTPFLLTTLSEAQLCQQCHDVPRHRFAHEPFAAGQCSVCHNPHESDQPQLLRGGTKVDHCGMCHDSLATHVSSTPDAHAPAKEDCTSCHSPHATAYPHQLSASIHDSCLACHTETAQRIAAAPVRHRALDRPESCSACHNPHVSEHKVLTHARSDQMCLSCHNEPMTTQTGRTIADMSAIMQRQYLHGPLRDGDCADCHDAHAADHRNLLRSAFPGSFYTGFELKKYDLCFNCHSNELVTLEKTDQLTGFRDDDRNLHYVHVHRQDKGRTCKTCHDVHGSNLPNHMAQSVPFEGSNWAMPIRFTSLDDGGSCAPGCHEPMRYRRSNSADTLQPHDDLPAEDIP